MFFVLWTTKHGHTSVGWREKIYIHQLCADTGYRLEELPKAMVDRDGWWKRIKRICAVNKPWGGWWLIIYTELYCLK